MSHRLSPSPLQSSCKCASLRISLQSRSPTATDMLALDDITTKPFRSLPSELCEEIFLACLPEKTLPTLNSDEAPLVITRVSKAWRDFALNTPKLWSSIHVPLPMMTQQTDKLISRICRRFGAAQSAPMRVSLWSPEITGALVQHPVTACVISHSFHIRTLELNVSTEVLAHFYPTASGPLDDDAVEEGESAAGPAQITLWPVLEKVILDFGMSEMDSPETRGDNVRDASFWLAPRLKSVTLISVWVDIFKLPLRWNQLEEITVAASGPHDYPDQLDYQSFTPGEAKHLLAICPKLSTLSIVMSGRGYESRFVPTLTPRRLTHHHLTNLHLEDIIIDPNIHSTTFLKELQLPSLQTLTYFLRRPQFISPTTALPRTQTFDNPLLCFLEAQKCPPPIAIFKTDAWSISYRGLLECLKLMPRLEALRMHGDLHSSCGDEFLNMFLPDDREERSPRGESKFDPPLRLPVTGLCPRLNDFIVNGADFSPDGVLRFVNSRLALSSCYDTPYARPQRFYAVLEKQRRPDFVARDGRGGTNSTEEALRGLGLDAKIVPKDKPSPPETFDAYPDPDWDDEPREFKIRPYDPKKGLPKWFGGDAEVWCSRHDR